MIEGHRIIVFGGSGSIGSELVRQLAEKNTVAIYDSDETATADIAEELNLQVWISDVRDRTAVLRVFEGFMPDTVFFAAARKHVSPCEGQPEEAVRTNVLGLIYAIEGAKRCGVERFVHVSTDKAAMCSSVMGTTKRLGEIIMKNAGYVSVRFGNVLGSNGSVVKVWQKAIDEGNPVKVTDARCERYAMTIEEACTLLIEAAEQGNPGEILCMDMGKPVNVLALAKEIIARSGRDVPIDMIGLRPGEVLTERLMTTDEEVRAVKRGRFYVIQS